jgi:hypothetical protein
MPEVVVLYKSTRTYIREKGEKPLQWYDGVKGVDLVEKYKQLELTDL